MKLATAKKGFTLVEIMIVVVIIGLLAALAIPAFKKVRNNAIEKTIFNDAKQLVSGANQIFAENPGTTTATYVDLVGPNKFISSLSSGNFVLAGGAVVPTAVTTANGSGNVLTAAGYFQVVNNNYLTEYSSNTQITNTTYYPVGTRGLQFSVDTGKLFDGAATPTRILN